jgi:soluble lytic murein transglycosylase-like protein
MLGRWEGATVRTVGRLATVIMALALLALGNAARGYTPRQRPAQRVAVQTARPASSQRVATGDLVAVFRAAGAAYGIDWRLLFAQCWKESGFTLNARGAAGEKGMAQFMPATWARFGRGDPDNPVNAAYAQAFYLAYIRRYLAARGITDPRMMIAGYNCGEGCAAAAGRFESLPAGVQGYAADIWRRYQYLSHYWR